MRDSRGGSPRDWPTASERAWSPPFGADAADFDPTDPADGETLAFDLDFDQDVCTP